MKSFKLYHINLLVNLVQSLEWISTHDIWRLYLDFLYRIRRKVKLLQFTQ